MRKDVAVLMVLWVMCIPYATFICASATPNKLDTLKAFLRKKILYDEYVPIDSVICWSENILPVIKTNNRNDENYFLLQLQLANAYTLRGDISLAIDRARLMYEEAKETEYEFGIAVANQAIGDAYTIANQCDKALDSYQDALKELNHLSQQHPYRIQLLLKISNALQRKGQLEKAQKTLHDIEQTLQKQPDYATSFFANIEKANYAISHGHLSKAYLKEAAAYLHNMDSIYRIHPEKFYCFHLKYTTAAYHRAMGNWNRMYWNKACSCMKSYDKNTRSTNSLPITDGSRKKQYTYIRYKGNQWPPACCIKNYIPLLTRSLQKVMSDKSIFYEPSIR